MTAEWGIPGLQIVQTKGPWLGLERGCITRDRGGLKQLTWLWGVPSSQTSHRQFRGSTPYVLASPFLSFCSKCPSLKAAPLRSTLQKPLASAPCCSRCPAAAARTQGHLPVLRNGGPSRLSRPRHECREPNPTQALTGTGLDLDAGALKPGNPNQNPWELPKKPYCNRSQFGFYWPAPLASFNQPSFYAITEKARLLDTRFSHVFVHDFHKCL